MNNHFRRGGEALDEFPVELPKTYSQLLDHVVKKMEAEGLRTSSSQLTVLSAGELRAAGNMEALVVGVSTVGMNQPKVELLKNGAGHYQFAESMRWPPERNRDRVQALMEKRPNLQRAILLEVMEDRHIAYLCIMVLRSGMGLGGQNQRIEVKLFRTEDLIPNAGKTPDVRTNVRSNGIHRAEA